MKKYTAVLLLLAIMLSLILSSCSSGRQEAGSVLTVYVMDWNSPLHTAVKKFNDSQSETRIVEKTFMRDQYADMQGRLKSELANGQGPDIIVAMPEMLPDLSKYVEAESFYSLDKLVKNDKGFAEADYNSNVMKCGIYNGSRYLMPLSYTVDALFTTGAIMDGTGIKTDEEGLVLSEVQDLGRAFKKQKDGEYLISNLDFEDYLLGGGFINVENSKASLDSPDFIELLKQYKQACSSVMPVDSFMSRTRENNSSLLLKEQDAAFISHQIGDYASLWQAYSGFDKEIDPILYPVPGFNGQTASSAKIYEFAAVNSKCKNTKPAFEFIKFLLSEDIQSQASGYGIPVNKKARDKIKNQLRKGRSTGVVASRGGGCTSDDTIRKLFGQADGITRNIDTCGIVDYEVISIIDRFVQEFLEGKITARDAAEAAQRKVTEYFRSPLEGKKAPAPGEQDSDDSAQKLTISYIEYQNFIKNAIWQYNKDNKDIQIEGTSSLFDSGSLEVFRKKLATSLMAGSGPDIIVFRPSYFNSLYKVATSGVFCDLNEFISKDKDFNMDELNSRVLDYGVYDGKRYFLPNRFNFNSLLTTKGALRDAGIIIDTGNWTWGQLHDIVKKYIQENKGTDKYFFDSCFSFRKMIESSGLQLVDSQKGKSAFNTREFIDLLNIYKDIKPAIAPTELSDKVALTQVLIREKNIVMMDQRYIGNPDELWGEVTAFDHFLGEQPVILTYPSYSKQNTSPVTLYEGIAINSNCRNKDAAFKFVKLLLSKDLQMANYKSGATNIIKGLSVNTAAYEEDVAHYTSDVVDGKEMNGVSATSHSNIVVNMTSISIPNETIRQVNDIYARIQPYGVIDEEIYRIAEEELQDFLDGRKTAEQTAKTIDDKATIYLNE